MFESTLKKMWQNAPQQEQIRFEKSRLLISLNHQIRVYNRKVQWSKSLEIGAACIVIGALIYFIYLYLFSSTLMVLGCSYLILWAIYVVYRLLKTQKAKHAATSQETLKSYLSNYRQYLLKEKNLAKTVLYWYLLPIIPGVALMLSSSIYNLQSSLQIVVGFVIIFTIIFILNHRSAKQEIQPLIDDVDHALEQIEANDEK